MGDYNSAEFWDFSFYEQGTIDIKAQVKRVADITNKKVDVFGFSQGTTSALIFTAEESDFAKQYVNATGVMGVCGRMAKSQTDEIFTAEIVDFLTTNNIWTIGGGPNWEDNYKKICDF